MNKSSAPFWKKPAKLFAWFALLFVSIFLSICCLALLSDQNTRLAGVVPFALVVSFVLAGCFTLILFLFQALASGGGLRRMGVIIGVLAVLVALFYVEENLRGALAWNSFRHQLEAKGEKVRLIELIPPAVPEDQNWALAPLLKTAMDFDQTGSGMVWRDTNALARLNGISVDLSPHGHGGHLVLGGVEKGTFADLPACADFYRDNTNYPQAPSSATAAETILVALSKYDQDLAELREAAVVRPYSRFPIEYFHEPPWNILLPHLARVKALTQLTYVRGTAALEAGKAAAALEDVKLGLRLSDSLHNEPLLIDHLVRLATLSINLQTIREGLVRHAWTGPQLTELQEALAKINLLAEYKLAMRGELAFETSGLDYIRRQGFKTNPMDNLGTEQGGTGPSPLFVLIPGGWLYQNMLTLGRIHGDFTLPAVDEQARRVFPDVSENGQRALAEMRSGPYTVFAKLLLPALGKAIKKSARMQTYVDTARIACALERYRLANNKLPTALDALVPSFIGAVPTDVVDGKPLRFLPDPDGRYLLYSVGWNKVDDGGELSLRTKKKDADPDLAAGDWVWQMEANL